MAVVITPDEVASFAQGIDPARVQLTIEGLIATAYRVAPCLLNAPEDSGMVAEAKLILLSALARFAGGNTNGIDTQSAGPFSVKYSPLVGTLSDRDKAQLRAICGSNGVFAIDTAPDHYRLLTVRDDDLSPLAGPGPFWANDNGMDEGFTHSASCNDLAGNRAPCEPMEFYGGVL